MGKDRCETIKLDQMKKGSYISLAAALLLLAGGVAWWQKRSEQNNITMGDKKLPRGYRNNNPLNIRINPANKWQGKVSNNTDGVFEQFVSMEYGYRAALKLIQNYINNYGLNTVAQIIAKWAPNNENNTAGYIQRVIGINQWTPAKIIDPQNASEMADLVYAMAIVENGNTILPSYTQIYKGWELL